MIGIPEQVTTEDNTEDVKGVTTNPNVDNKEPTKDMKPKIASIGYSVTMLLIPSIVPNDKIELNSSRLKIENLKLVAKSVNHVGSNFGNDFYTKIEAYQETVKVT